jgi:hypothetical protein
LLLLDGESNRFTANNPGHEYSFISEMNNTGAAFGYGLHDSNMIFSGLC